MHLDIHTAGKVTDYDPTTGTGDRTFTDYTGGTCNGANFDNTGATVTSTGTFHLLYPRMPTGLGARRNDELTSYVAGTAAPPATGDLVLQSSGDEVLTHSARLIRLAR